MGNIIPRVGNSLWSEWRRPLGQWPRSALIALAIGAALLAQTTDSSTTATPQAARAISGKVVNEDGEPLPDIEVRVSLDWSGSSPSFGKMPDVRTDDHGEYRISGLASNRYWVAASAPNYSYPCEDPHWETPEMGYAGAGTPVVVDLQSAAPRDRIDFVLPRVMLRQAERIEGPSAEVSGDVVDVLRGKPVKNALVEFRLRNSGLKAPCYAAESDGGGRFRLPNVPPGEYYAEAHHVGLGQVPEGEDYYPIMRFAAGQPAQVSLKMIPSAVISGRVIDEEGHPVPGAIVGMGHNQYLYGMPKQVVFAPSAATDDRGEFRLWYLAPGTYTPRVSPPALTNPGERIAHARGAFPVPSFLGGAIDLSHAKPILVAPGDDSRVGDIVLHTERRFTVRGAFQGYDSSLRYSVLLKDQSQTDANVAFGLDCEGILPKYSGLLTKISGPDFEIQDVPPGKYFVTATAATAGRANAVRYARAMIEVADRDVNDVALGFVPPIEIKGQIISGVPGLDRSGLIANLLAEGCDGKLAKVSADGSFVLPTVRPDMYQFSIGYHLGVPEGTYLQSIQVDSSEIQSSIVDLTSGAPQLTAIYANDVASLQGIVTDAEGRPVRATVYFDHDGGTPSYRFAPLPVRSDDAGRFTVATIVPGDYRVSAFSLPFNPAESDPEFRGQFLDQSTVLHVEPGVPKTINLRAISKK